MRVRVTKIHKEIMNSHALGLVGTGWKQCFLNKIN